SGCSSRLRWVFRLPLSKWKSCAPARGGAGFASSARAGRAGAPASNSAASSDIHPRRRSVMASSSAIEGQTLGASMSSDKNAPAGAYRAAPPHPLAHCPLHAAFRAVGGKWKLTILYWLAREPNHFSGLQRRVAPITHKVLTEQLRELEEDGLVEREVTGPVPAPVLYRLSEYGGTLVPLVGEARRGRPAHLAPHNGPEPAVAVASLACASAS